MALSAWRYLDESSATGGTYRVFRYCDIAMMDCHGYELVHEPPALAVRHVSRFRTRLATAPQRHRFH